MPRAASRRFQPCLRVLRKVIDDESAPLPLRIRSIELSLAVLSGCWEIASGKAAAKAVRSIVALDAIDKQLLELTGMVNTIRMQQQEQQQAPAETKEVTIGDLLAMAEAERKHGTATATARN